MIPQFKNTQSALSYGRFVNGDWEKIMELKRESKLLHNKINELLIAGAEKEALYLASGQSQFVNEALKEATRN